jgi:Cupin domain
VSLTRPTDVQPWSRALAKRRRSWARRAANLASNRASGFSRRGAVTARSRTRLRRCYRSSPARPRRSTAFAGRTVSRPTSCRDRTLTTAARTNSVLPRGSPNAGATRSRSRRLWRQHTAATATRRRSTGLEGVLTWTVDGTEIEVGPGEVLVVPRGAVHHFDNRGEVDAKQPRSSPPASSAPDFFREVGATLDAAAGGPPDLAAIGVTPWWPSRSSPGNRSSRQPRSPTFASRAATRHVGRPTPGSRFATKL